MNQTCLYNESDQNFIKLDIKRQNDKTWKLKDGTENH